MKGIPMVAQICFVEEVWHPFSRLPRRHFSSRAASIR
jgi:hypothetical protein